MPNSNDAGFQIISALELLSAPPESVPFCVDGLLPTSGLSLIVGKPKVGKSTLARQLAVCLVQGNEFLGRTTVQSRVLYFALEEKLTEVQSHFSLLGLEAGDPLLTHFGMVSEHALNLLEQTLQSDPGIRVVIIDPLFRFIRMHDGNDYAKVTTALEPLLALARKYKVHIVTVHHRKKRRSDDAMDDVLGSTAIFAAVDTVIMLDAAGHVRSLGSRQRYGSPFSEVQLNWNPDKRELTVGISVEEERRNQKLEARKRIERDLCSYLVENPGAIREELQAAVRGNVQFFKEVFRGLVRNGAIRRTGSGTKGDPFKYWLTEIPVEGVTKSLSEESPE